MLLVDDNPANLLALEAVLEPLQVPLHKASSGREALRYLMREDYAVVLLDVQMEGLSGLETAALIKQRERSRDVPIIFLTAYPWTQQDVLAAYGSGGADFLTKPFVPQVLCAKVAVFLDLYRAREELKHQAALLQARERELLERSHQEQLHRIFMQQSSAAIAITRGPDFIFEFANPLYEKIIGRPVELGAPLSQVLPEVLSQPTVMAALRRVLATGEPFVATEFEVRLDRHGTGQTEEAFFNLTYQPTWDARGQVDGLITFSVEVTEFVRARRRADALATELKRNSEQLERWDLLFHHAGWGIASTDPGTWRMKAVNPAFARMHGYDSPEQIVGRHVEEMLAPEALDNFRAELARTIEKGHHTYENLHVRQDGTRFPTLVDGVALKDAQGNVTYRAASFQDLTARKEAEDRFAFLARAGEALSSSLDEDTVLQRLAELVVPRYADWCSVDLLTERGTVERRVVVHREPEKVALAFEIARRWPIDLQAHGGIAQVLRTGEPLCLPEIPDAALAALARGEEHLALSRALGLKSSLCVPLQARGRVLGAFSLSIESGPRRYGPADVELARDLARRASLCLDNALLFRDAQSGIRLRDEFLSVASHELKTPLTSLKLQHTLIERAVDEGPREKVRTRMLAATRQVSRLASLVDSLLDVSRLSLGKLSLELSEVDLAQVVKDGHERLEAVFAQAGCDVRLDVVAAARGHWDGSRLEQVVVNLLSNAAKYGAGKPVSIRVDTEGRLARLQVRDEGIGISAEAFPRLFGRFERGVSERHYGGLGLGLYISRQIVEAMGGTIQVESQQGHGALFTVRLPMGSRPASASDASPAS
ncbi:ATP-binding protein [Pyxidicoccus sp. 3LFB2]